MKKETQDTRIELTLEMVEILMKGDSTVYVGIYIFWFVIYAFLGWAIHYYSTEFLGFLAPHIFELFPLLYPAIVCICGAFPAFFAVRSIYSVVSKVRMVRRGEFGIVKDTLYAIGEKEDNFSLYNAIIMCDTSKYVNSLYFKQYGRYIMGGDGYQHSIKKILECSSPGDTFYIAVYKTNPETPVFVFNAKMFRWAGDEQSDSDPDKETEDGNGEGNEGHTDRTDS